MRHNPSYGKGVHVLDDADETPNAHAEEIAERLTATFNSPHYSPPVLPAAAIEVHRLSQQKDVQIEHILAVLEKDPLLAARVLRTASSSVYGGQQLQSLQIGVVRLGLRTLSDLVWEVALNMRVFKSKAYQAPMEAVRRHSIAVAHTAREVAKNTAVPLEYAFLCGLLHDVGAAAALHLLGEGGSNTGKPLSEELLGQVLQKSHADASQLVARLWSLPADVQLVLASHHTVTAHGFPHPTAAIVAVAESLVREESRAAQLSWDNSSEQVVVVARDALKVSLRTIDSLKTNVRTILERLEHSA